MPHDLDELYGAILVFLSVMLALYIYLYARAK